MSTNLFTYAVPAFIGAMVLEAAVTFKRRRPVYSIVDSFSNLGCGMGSQLAGFGLTAVTVAIYTFVFERWRLLDWTLASPWIWIVALLGQDFIYYVWHRLSHVVNFLWATHVVHHQSEEYNLSVALRQSWFSNAFSWVFYLPLALLGVPPFVYLVVSAVNLLYQFVIHVKAVRTLGWLDWLLNTPSHHRVHHGSNTIYLDKNFGGMLIIWDRLFGSFQPETVPVEYGLVKPLKSFNPLWANVHYWYELLEASLALPGIGNKLKVWVKNPGWLPGDQSPADAIQRAEGRVYSKYILPTNYPAIFYVLLQMVAVLGATVLVMAKGSALSNAELLLLYGGALSSMALWERLLTSAQRGVIALEAMRLMGLGIASALVIGQGNYASSINFGLGAFFPVAGALLLRLYLRVLATRGFRTKGAETPA